MFNQLLLSSTLLILFNSDLPRLHSTWSESFWAKESLVAAIAIWLAHVL